MGAPSDVHEVPFGEHPRVAAWESAPVHPHAIVLDGVDKQQVFWNLTIEARLPEVILAAIERTLRNAIRSISADDYICGKGAAFGGYDSVRTQI